jgi:hypothetical protein
MMEKESRKAKVLFLRGINCDRKFLALMMIISTYLISECKNEDEDISLLEFGELVFLTESIATNVSLIFFIMICQFPFIQK